MRRALIALALAALGVSWTGCGDGENVNRERAREFRGFQLYWLGESFKGQELEHTEVLKPFAGRPLGRVSFVYGTCEPPPGPDGGCPPPYDIQNYSSCERHLALPIGPGGALGEFEEVPVPGAARGFLRGGGVEVYTRVTNVVVFANEYQNVGNAVRALRPLQAAEQAAPLPAPAPGAIRGRADCTPQGGSRSAVPRDNAH